MEPTGHYWFALGKSPQDSGTKPVHVKKSKKLDDNTPNKNDRKDPKTIVALLNEGRFSYPYIPTGIHAEIRGLSNLSFQTQEELKRIRNRLARRFSIYFPEDGGIDNPMLAVQRAASNQGGATDWELLQIKLTPSSWDRITWFLNGEVVSNPFD